MLWLCEACLCTAESAAFSFEAKRHAPACKGRMLLILGALHVLAALGSPHRQACGQPGCLFMHLRCRVPYVNYGCTSPRTTCGTGLLRRKDCTCKKNSGREVEDFNRRVQAMAYRDWEEWVVLNTAPSGGYASPGGPGARGGGRKRTTQVEALVQQGGVSIGKRARWQLEINESRPLLVQFEIGIRGNGTQVVNARSHGPAALVEARPNTTNETAAPNRAAQSGGAMELSASGRDSGAGADSGTGRGELRGSGLAGEGGPGRGGRMDGGPPGDGGSSRDDRMDGGPPAGDSGGEARRADGSTADDEKDAVGRGEGGG